MKKLLEKLKKLKCDHDYKINTLVHLNQGNIISKTYICSKCGKITSEPLFNVKERFYDRYY